MLFSLNIDGSNLKSLSVSIGIKRPRFGGGGKQPKLAPLMATIIIELYS